MFAGLPGVRRGQSERVGIDSLDEVVESLGGSVGHLGDVPIRDLGGPARDGAAQFVDLGRAGPLRRAVRKEPYRTPSSCHESLRLATAEGLHQIMPGPGQVSQGDVCPRLHLSVSQESGAMAEVNAILDLVGLKRMLVPATCNVSGAGVYGWSSRLS